MDIIDSVKDLEKVGFSRLQAEAQLKVVGKLMQDHAKKSDIEALGRATKGDIESLAKATKDDIDRLAEATRNDIAHLKMIIKQNSIEISDKFSDAAKLNKMQLQHTVELFKEHVAHQSTKTIIRLGALMVSLFAIAGFFIKYFK